VAFWRLSMTILDRLAAPFSAQAQLRVGLRLIERGLGAKGVRHLARAGRRNCVEAQYQVGRCYLEGQAVPQSRAEAMRWLEPAAERGHAQAQLLVAALFVQGAGYETAGRTIATFFSDGEGAEPDFEAALSWARRAAEQGGVEAQALVGNILTSGPVGLRDPAQAERWYRLCSEAGYPQGSLGLGLALLRAARSDETLREAALEILKAADAGLSTAQYLLGTMTEFGVGVPRDLAAAAQLYRAAAQKGVPQAQMRWGLALLQGRGTGRNIAAGESWLRRAAEAGEAGAAALVGYLYAKGGDAPPNYPEAMVWLKRAAEQGHVAASRMLGQLYFTGAAGEVDRSMAAHWLQRAAVKGDRPAQADLGNLALTEGSASDLLDARSWFEQAADGGDLVAAFNFAICLAEGVGVERDERKAMLWLRRAAEGVSMAQYWYGRLLAEGRGMDADPAEARIWLGRAAEAGIVEAQVMLGEMMLNGRGGSRDKAVARELFAQAAAQGSGAAMFALGVLAEGDRDGRAVAQDWFRRAAEGGHPYGQLMLGRYLARGLAGSADPLEAEHWLTRAKAAGLADAQLELDRLARIASAPSLSTAAG
jgi:TPR repeat protein